MVERNQPQEEDKASENQSLYASEGRKSLRKDLVQTFVISFKADPTTETFETEFNRILEAIKAAGSFEKHIEKEFPIIEDPSPISISINDYVTDVLQIVLYRLIWLEHKKGVVKDHKSVAKGSFCRLLELALKEIREQNEEKATFLMSVILNISRSYIDDDPESVMRGSIIADKSRKISIVTQEELKGLPYIQHISDALDLMREIYKTKKFGFKLNEFLRHYAFKEADNNVKEQLINSLNSIVWLKDCPFAGMVGLNLKTYLNLSTIEGIYARHKTSERKVKKAIMAFIVSTKLHEDAHHLVRINQNNYLALTPNTERQWESGYIFETMLFGAIISDYDKAGGIHTIDGWKGKEEIVILHDDDIEAQKSLYSTMNLYLSGICAVPERLSIK